VSDIEEHWRAALGRVRAGSAVELLLGALPGAPIVSVSGAAELIGRSFQATNQAMHRLEAAGVVRQISVGRRNRAHEATAILDAFTTLERQLASPAAIPVRRHPGDRHQRGRRIASQLLTDREFTDGIDESAITD